MHKSHQQNLPPAPDGHQFRNAVLPPGIHTLYQRQLIGSMLKFDVEKNEGEKKTLKIHLFTFCASCFENFPVSSLLVCAGVTVLCAAAASKRRAPITGRFLWPDARCFLSTKVKISATFRLEFLSFLVLRIMDTFPERNSVVPEADKHCFFSFLVCLFYR